MSMISKLKNVTYDFSITEGENAIFVVPDLLTRVTTRSTVDSLDQITDPYVIKEGETPEQVSFNVYGTVNYYDIILQLNMITSVREDWPMTESQLEEFTKKKYTGFSPDVTYEYELMGIELSANSTTLRLESQQTSNMNAQNFWKMNVGDFVSNASYSIFPKGTQVVSFTENQGNGEYEVIMSKPSLLAIKAANAEAPDYPKTFTIKFNPMIEAHLAVRHWEDSLGVVREKDHITTTLEWGTQAGITTDEFVTQGDTAYAVTNLNYEISLNDAKRNIKVIKPNFISSYVDAINGELAK